MASFAALDRLIQQFMSSEAAQVLIIRGNWGVGKTFAWNKYLEKEKDNLKIERYAYVSMFGINSIESFRFAIFENTIRRDQIGKTASLETLKSSIETIFRKNSSLIKIAQNFANSGTKEAINQILPLFMTVKDQLICIDDVERRGFGIDIRDVLGLCSFLKEQRNCKIVILLNDDALNQESKVDFENYLEKLMDYSTTLTPTPAESADIAITKNDELAHTLKESCINLEISNVRLIQKIENLCRSADKELFEYTAQTRNHATRMITLFAWSIFSPNNAPSLEFITPHNRSLLLRENDGEQNVQNQAWSSKLLNYGLSQLSEFEFALIEGIRDNTFCKDDLAIFAKILDQKYQAQEAAFALSEAWSLYLFSFAANEFEVTKAIYNAFKLNIKHVTLTDLDAAVKLFKQLNQFDMAKHTIELFMLNSPNIQIYAKNNSFSITPRVDDDDVKTALESKLNENIDQKNPAELLAKLDTGWNESDISYLSNLSVDEYKNLFKKINGPALGAAISGALKFDRVVNASPEMRKICEKAKSALIQIGSENMLNKLRVAEYGIEIQPDP